MKTITLTKFNFLIKSFVENFSDSKLKDGITHLDCRFNELTTLPAIPSSVTHLDCRFNKLTTLPSIPISVTYLDCNNNKFKNSEAIYNSETSNRVAVYSNGKIFCGCFTGTLDEFYKKGFISEKKQWVSDFYNLIKPHNKMKTTS